MVRVHVLSVVMAAAILSACSSATIAIKENLGIPKREQLVARVKDGRDEQQRAKQQFSSALAEFVSVTGVGASDLEGKYDKLKKEYERSESRAEAVHSRINDIERVADALFKEWKAELSQYSNASLKQASQKELDATRGKYDALLGAMKAAESKMQPVLTAFKDQVLFLKHNLNARAIASLQGNVAQIQSDVGSLIRDMEASIAEANAFIDQMQKTDGK